MKTDNNTLNDSFNNAIKLVNRAILRKKKILFIIGAGASHSAKIPLMKDIYKDLQQKLTKTDNAEGIAEQLNKWLNALIVGNAPRSVATLALGTFQKATGNNDIISNIWHDFSNDFLKGKIKITEIKNLTEQKLKSNIELPQAIQLADNIKKFNAIWEVIESIQKDNNEENGNQYLINKEPTLFHYFVASLVKLGWAHVISLNFDGLTRKALNNIFEHENSESKEVAVILSSKENIDAFYTSESNHKDKKVYPIIKVWGDVFHAVCRNPQCPVHDKRIPIFSIKKLKDDKNNLLICDTCQSSLQLEIYFAGYEKKEQSTKEILESVIEYIFPEIDCVITAGFSGLWDTLLVDLISILSQKIDQDYRFEKEVNILPSCLCIDPVQSTEFEKEPFLVRELKKKKVNVLRIPVTSDNFAKFFQNNLRAKEVNNIEIKQQVIGKNDIEDDKLWVDNKLDLINNYVNKGCFFSQYESIVSKWKADCKGLKNLQQLGIKTKISSPGDKSIIDHSRFYHSIGVAHLTVVWTYILMNKINNIKNGSQNSHVCQPDNDNINNFASPLQFIAALNHDIGHVPFTHMTEEIFKELSWSLRKWEDSFKHDNPVLFSISDNFKEVKTSMKIFRDDLKLNDAFPEENDFINIIESIIQGCSGTHWIDAISNSPLDADKLDYVNRDCDFLEQSLHILEKNESSKIKNFFENTRVLESGLLALEGFSGDFARIFLEERYWLYKNQYLRRGFRAMERLAQSILIKWMIVGINNLLIEQNNLYVIYDTRSIKGEKARELLWQRLIFEKDQRTSPGNNQDFMEPELLVEMCRDLLGETKFDSDQKLNRAFSNIQLHKDTIEWIKCCREIFTNVFNEYNPKVKSLADFLQNNCNVNMSECFYTPLTQIKEIREIVRKLELERPNKVLVDIAIAPAYLSYPESRKILWKNKIYISECIVVSHKDPDRWGLPPTNKWIPLSKSYFSEKDKKRWAKIMFVTPHKHCSEDVWLMKERFLQECYYNNIQVKDADPEGFSK